MAKRMGLALVLVVIAGVVLFVLLRGATRDSDEHGSTTSGAPQENSPATANPDGEVLGQDGEPIPGDAAGALPMDSLDRALETVTGQIEVPKGIHSREIPEDNGVHQGTCGGICSAAIKNQIIAGGKDEE